MKIETKEDIIDQIMNPQTNHILWMLLKTNIDKPTEVVGAALINHNTELHWMTLKYLVIKSEYRKCGLGTYFVNLIKEFAAMKLVDYLVAVAHNSSQEFWILKHEFCEFMNLTTRDKLHWWFGLKE